MSSNASTRQTPPALDKIHTVHQHLTSKSLTLQSHVTSDLTLSPPPRPSTPPLLPLPSLEHYTLTPPSEPSTPHIPHNKYNTRSKRTTTTRPILPGLTIDPALMTNRSAHHPQHKPSKPAKRKRKHILKDDPLQQQEPSSKRVNTEQKPTPPKKEKDNNTSQQENEEDDELWSHFRDWDWDTILQHLL